MAPRLSKVPLFLAALLSCQETLAQIVTETSFVTINDVTTFYTCAQSGLPLCGNVVWSAASTESTDTTPTGTDTGTQQVTVTETETEGGTTDTVTSIDVSTEVESVTETITQFTSSSVSATASTVPTLVAGDPVNLSLTDANGNALLLVVDSTGVVRFVSPTSADAANAQQVFADDQGVFHLVSDPNRVIYFGIPSTGRRSRIMRRQDAAIDPTIMAMLAAYQSSLGPNDAIASWKVDASGGLVCTSADGTVVELYLDPVTGTTVPVPSGDTPPAGLLKASAVAKSVTTTQPVTGAPLSSFTFSFASSGTTSSSSAKVVKAQRKKRQSPTTPAALTTYSAAALTSACQGFIGSTWSPVTTIIESTPATTVVTSVNYQYSFTTTLPTYTSTSFTSTYTSWTSTLAIAAAQTANVKIATGTGANIQYLVLDVAGVASAKYPLKLGAVGDATVFSIDNYGRISTSYTPSGGSATDYFLLDPTAGTPGAGKAMLAIAGSTSTSGYWLSFYFFGATHQLVIDPQRNNPATANDPKTGEHLFLMCTYSPTTYKQLAFGVSTNTNTGGTDCTETTFYLTT
ncbi:hypothetical protein TWF191_002721 [Orbilia oligospora]|uniref:Uncharacterized protein n=1 Tax=Orbilia oligospora TaxID=2813651 RepID=A0A7C8UZA1_ORBOL|nr:hypothetical protein TWF191_002721 [Orbilia oligospora]